MPVCSMPAFIKGRALRERASADKSPSRDVKKRLAALFAIEFSIGPYPVLPRCPHNPRAKVPTRITRSFTARNIPIFSSKIWKLLRILSFNRPFEKWMRFTYLAGGFIIHKSLRIISDIEFFFTEICQTLWKSVFNNHMSHASKIC